VGAGVGISVARYGRFTSPTMTNLAMRKAARGAARSVLPINLAQIAHATFGAPRTSAGKISYRFP
jgi:hypothetical protein